MPLWKRCWGTGRPIISQHLAVLREAGLVQDRRDGWNVFYQATGPDIFDVLRIVAALAGEPDPSHEALLAAENCPCPKCNS